MKFTNREQLISAVLAIPLALIFLIFVMPHFFPNTVTPPDPIIITQPAPPLAVIKEPAMETVEPDLDDAELDCLAKNIYHEARGESREGKIAVAHVTMNRVNSKRFPNTVCGVVHQAVYSTWWLEARGRKVPVRNKCQFSWYCDGKSDRIRLTNSDGKPLVPNVRAWSESQTVAMEVMLELVPDNTGGATFYYNPSLADPYWKHHFEKTVMVDNHKFMRAP